MLEMVKIFINQLKWSTLLTIINVVALAQSNNQTNNQTNNMTTSQLQNLIGYELKNTQDGNILCKRPQGRNPKCNDDFDNCTSVVTVYDYYIISYGLGGLAANLAGVNDAQRHQKLQQKAAELAQQARQNGQDLNVTAFDNIDDHAKGELVWLRSKQILHFKVIAYVNYLLWTWPNQDKSYLSESCQMDISNEISKLDAGGQGTIPPNGNDLACISSPKQNDISGSEGCRRATVELTDYDFYEDSSEATVPKNYGASLQDIHSIMFKAKNNFTWSSENIPFIGCGEGGLNIEKFVEDHFTDDLLPFMKGNFPRMKCFFEMKKTSEARLSSGTAIKIKMTKPNEYKVTITACKHLCDTNFNFFSYVIPNLEEKNKVKIFLGTVQKNLEEINAKIAQMEGLRSEVDKEKQAYLDSLKNQTGGTEETDPEQEKLDCTKNPYLAGCAGRVTGGYGSGGNNYQRKTLPVPTAGASNLPGTVTGDIAGGDFEKKPTGASRNAGDSTGGAGGGGGGAPSASGTGDGGEETKKNEEQDKASVDVQGVEDYGGKRKASSGGVANTFTTGGSNTKKVKNPFEDLFGDKKGKTDNSGIHLRDIASSNEAEDEANGYSNLFSRISKTYFKKYHQGQIGDKNSKK